MVNVVVLSASPEGKEVVQAPGELVTAVRINGLEKAEDNPAVHGQDVKILSESAPNDGTSNGTKTENHNFDGGGVFSGEAKGSRVLVVDLVDVLVEEGAGVHGAVGPIVPGVLHDEEDGDLVGHLVERRERNAGLETEVLAHGVEQPDLRKLDSEVGEEDEKRALCLLPGRGDLVLFVVRILDYPRIGAFRRTCWILYFLNMGSISTMIHGSDRPK